MGRDPGSSRLRERRVDEARLLTKAHLSDYSPTDISAVKSFFASATSRGDGPTGRMFVVNKGPHGAGYYWCTRCEYAESAPHKAQYGRQGVQSKHKNPRTGDPCPNEQLVDRFDLGHVFETDIRAIHFDRSIPDSSATGDANPVERFRRTLAEALRLAAARLLDTDSRDLRAATELRDGRPIIILSDAAAGGAGYCRRLLDEPRFRAARLLAEARDILDCSNEDCATSCSRCLNEYSNQYYWDDFDRQPCRNWIDSLLRKTAKPPAGAPQDAIPDPSASTAVLSDRLRSRPPRMLRSSRLLSHALPLGPTAIRCSRPTKSQRAMCGLPGSQRPIAHRAGSGLCAARQPPRLHTLSFRNRSRRSWDCAFMAPAGPGCARWRTGRRGPS